MVNGQLTVKYKLSKANFFSLNRVDLALDKAMDALLAMWQYERQDTKTDKLGSHLLIYKKKENKA